MKEIYIAKGGRESGPFQEAQIASMQESGMLASTDSIWHQDLAGWIPVWQFLNLRPPIPGAQPVRTSAPVSSQVIPKKIAVSGDPAPFGRRLGAHAIDTIPCLVICFIMWIMMFGLMDLLAIGVSSSAIVTAFQMIIGVIMLFVPPLLPVWLWHALWESSAKRAFPGKIMCGLVVTDMNGQRLTFSQAGKRAVGKAFSQLICYGLLIAPSSGTDPNVLPLPPSGFRLPRDRVHRS